jgi:hypothetical protein
MKSRRGSPPQPAAPHITISVSGKLLQGHLSYLDQLVHTARECHLWPVLNLAGLEEVDRAAVLYLIGGENRDFELISCPSFVRQRVDDEKQGSAAA